jgi:hypothetical protein
MDVTTAKTMNSITKMANPSRSSLRVFPDAKTSFERSTVTETIVHLLIVNANDIETGLTKVIDFDNVSQYKEETEFQCREEPSASMQEN